MLAAQRPASGRSEEDLALDAPRAPGLECLLGGVGDPGLRRPLPRAPSIVALAGHRSEAGDRAEQVVDEVGNRELGARRRSRGVGLARTPRSASWQRASDASAADKLVDRIGSRRPIVGAGVAGASPAICRRSRIVAPALPVAGRLLVGEPVVHQADEGAAVGRARG